MFRGSGNEHLIECAILARATAQLQASPNLHETAARDALTLLLHTLCITRAQFYADPDREITPQQQAAYEADIARRMKSEPIQYITGEQEFFGLTLRVTPAVLIPRPETEHLVEAVLPEFKYVRVPRVLDVGTGSGAIAIALAHHLPEAQIVATDISCGALAVAKGNAMHHELGERIEFLESDLLASVGGPFDAIVSNPPYVPEADRATLHPQVREFEPSGALFAGSDGLAIYRRLIPQARAALVPNGLLAFEIGHGQRDAIAQLLADWNLVRFLDDLQGIPRVALARKP
jgi:release factor glutamine methyltransferase